MRAQFQEPPSASRRPNAIDAEVIATGIARLAASHQRHEPE